MGHGQRVIVLVTLALGIRCDSRKSSPATGATEPLPRVIHEPAPVAAAPAAPDEEAPTTPSDAGPAEWYACRKPDDCAVVSEGRCCTPCDPVAFRGYTAVNTKHKADFAAHEGC